MNAKKMQTPEKYFRVEVSDHKGQIVAIESETLSGRDIGYDECETIVKSIRHLNGFVGANFVDLTCEFDPLNPCWNGRPSDIVGKHWGIGDACSTCNARAAISRARG